MDDVKMKTPTAGGAAEGEDKMGVETYLSSDHSSVPAASKCRATDVGHAIRNKRPPPSGRATGRKPNATGRSKGAPPFVMLPQWAFDCPAFRSLRPGPRALLWEFIRRFNGTNNGRIGFGQRDMAVAINIKDRETVATYVRELEEKGFVRATRRSGFNLKSPNDRRATEWALTFHSVGDETATKEFMRWLPSIFHGTE